MMKRPVYLLILFFMPVLASAADKTEYASDKIDKSLLANANAIIRVSEQVITVNALDNVTVSSHFAITILKKEGDQYALLKEYFSKLQSIEDLHGFVYDKTGKQQAKIRESDFKAFAVTQNAGYYDDNKVKAYQVSYHEYPYTIEFFSEIKQLHSFHFPEWQPRPEYDIAVEKASFKVIALKSAPIRYRAVNTQLKPTEKSLGETTSYEWTIANIQAERDEFLARDKFDGSPVVFIAPTDFILAGYNGNMNDWRSMGAFIYQLGKDRDELSDEKKIAVTELTSSLKSDREKIAVLYKYMQEHTRYVSIQYGVGGWQTLEAKFVSENQYGDCKALSNYMSALLKQAGIKSYPVVIYAGSGEIEEMPHDFAVNTFDHEILCVPLGKDTVWLECTSKDYPVNFLGSFTADRNALMITPDGGVVVHTPNYDTTVNRVCHKAVGKCGSDGSITFDINSVYSGVPAEKLTGWQYMNEQQKEQFVHSKLHLSRYQASDYRLERKDANGTLSLDEHMTVIAGNMINKVGAYQLVDVDLCPLKLPFKVQVTDRKKSFVFGQSYQVCDTFEIGIDADLTVSELPQPVMASTPFGRYEFSVKSGDNKLVAVRKLIVYKGEFKPEQYADYEGWVDVINQQKNYSVVLQNK